MQHEVEKVDSTDFEELIRLSMDFYGSATIRAIKERPEIGKPARVELLSSVALAKGTFQPLYAWEGTSPVAHIGLSLIPNRADRCPESTTIPTTASD
jgi:hypothetical protein